MIKEAIDALTSIGRNEQPLKVINPRGEPDHVYLLVGPEGQREWMITEPKPRSHTATDLSAVTQFAKRFQASKDLEPGPVIWYYRTAVVCLIEDSERRDKVTLPLDYSPQMKVLRSLEGPAKPMCQAEMVLMMRTTFRDSVEACPEIIDILRSIKFQRNEDGESEIKQGKKSIGNRLTAEMTGSKALPEYVTLNVPIWANGFSAWRAVECALEAYPEEQAFRLIPMPLQIEMAIVDAEASLADEIGEQAKDIPVYYGTP